MHARFWIFIAVCLALPSTAAAADKTRKLAVMPLAAKRVPKDTVRILDDLVITSVHRLGRYEVISTEDIAALLGLEKMKDAVGCDSVSCAASIGGALGADLLLSGSVGKLGDEVVVTLTLIDITQAKVIGRSQRRAEDKEALYSQVMALAVADLWGTTPASAASGAPAAAGDKHSSAPWRDLGIARATWEQYQTYHAAAEDAAYTPLALEAWQKEVVPQQADWSSYFAYRVRELDLGKKPLEFAAWYTELKLGRIEITSQPSGASVTLSGETLGTTPLTIKGRPAGRYVVQVSLAGFEPEERPVELEDGKALTVAIELVDPRERARARGRLPAWLTGGAAVVAAAGAATLFLLAPSRADLDARYAEIDAAGNRVRVDELQQELDSQIARQRLFVGLGWGAAGLAVVGAGVSAFLFLSAGGEGTAPSVTVVPGPDGVQGLVSFDF